MIIILIYLVLVTTQIQTHSKENLPPNKKRNCLEFITLIVHFPHDYQHEQSIAEQHSSNVTFPAVLEWEELEFLLPWIT